MDNEILKKQIEALEKLLSIKDKIIEDLEKRLQNQNIQITPYTETTVSPFLVEVCQHEYPFPWNATIPPNCKKCGQQAQPYVVTYGTGN